MNEGVKLPIPGEVPEPRNYLTREERKQLDALSKLLTGKSSSWSKALKQGHRAPMEETLEDGTIRKYVGIKYPTLAEVKEEMDKALKDKVLKEKLEAEKKAKVEESVGTETSESIRSSGEITNS